LIGIPKAIAMKPASTAPIPAISKTIIINLTPWCGDFRSSLAFLREP
jgi:hypothetical protein